jgi:hypothetical protein
MFIFFGICWIKFAWLYNKERMWIDRSYEYTGYLLSVGKDITNDYGSGSYFYDEIQTNAVYAFKIWDWDDTQIITDKNKFAPVIKWHKTHARQHHEI